jgi:short-subunit dehydrogenase
LVAGASEGIGASFAALLASRGLDVVLVARRAQPLRQLAERIEARHSVATRVIAADLGAPSGVDTVLAEAPEVGLLVCNAASAPVAEYLDLGDEQITAMIDLNCRSAAALTHTLGARMVARGRGGVILLSSAASFQGSGLVAHYAATKAYLRVLAEGLWSEWRPHGVDVLACCPGLVATPTFEATNPTPGALVPPPLSSDVVARQALAALGRRPVVVPGLRNRLAMLLATRLLSRRAAIALSSNQTARMYRSWSTP